MSSPIHRQVLTPKKPIWLYRLEQKIAAQDKRIQILENALEESTLENKELRQSIDSKAVAVPTGEPKSPTGSPQFRISL